MTSHTSSKAALEKRKTQLSVRRAVDLEAAVKQYQVINRTFDGTAEATETPLMIPHITQLNDGSMVLPNLKRPFEVPDLVIPVKMKKIPYQSILD